MPTMIELDDLARSYGSRAATVHALQDVRLAMGPGVWAVVGPNGAGKTTLLGLILGFLRPTSGTVRIGGLPPRRYVRRKGASYLPERFRLPPEWPVRSTLRTLARLEGLNGAAGDTRANEVMERLGLEPHADKTVGALSRGLNQRLGLAQALLAPRELVVLDEPTEGLDPLWRIRFRETVSELRGEGRTVVLASHELPEVERAADHVVLLQDGRVRDVMSARDAGAGPLRYRLDVVVDPATLAEVFPGARPEAGAAAARAQAAPADATIPADPAAPSGARSEYGCHVEVADHAELSARLAALIDGGATIRAVVPEGTGLEERVRERLEEPVRERPGNRAVERPEAEPVERPEERP